MILLVMDYFHLVKFSEVELAKARASNRSLPLKKTTALWLSLEKVTQATDLLPLEIRPVINEQDWQKMLELRVRVESRFGVSKLEDVLSMINEIKMCQSKLKAQWYLAYLPDSLAVVGEIGLVQFVHDGLRFGRLQDVDIDPDFQGKGLGDALLSTIISKSITEGLQALCLKADSDDWPLRWYEQRGFTPLGEWMS